MALKKIKSRLGYYALRDFIRLSSKKSLSLLGYFALRDFMIYQFRVKKYTLMMPFVYGEIATLEKVIQEKCSVARFGDGEMELCMGYDTYGHEFDERLSQRLNDILANQSPFKDILVCISPHTSSCYSLSPRVRIFNYRFFVRHKNNYISLLNPDRKYGSTYMSRPEAFMFKTDQLDHYKSLLRKLWNNEDVLIVTGKGSRFIFIPELFDNIKSSEFIYGLPENAFRQYDDLLAQIKCHSREKLVLLALGPAATVLAYDLSRDGYRAIDIGNLPNCYEVAKEGLGTIVIHY